MTNEEAVKQIKGNCYFASISEKTKEALDMAIKALEQQQDVHDTCIEDYPTCTECEHYDSEKHYCPRFCQVIKDTLAEAQPSEDCISRDSLNDAISELTYWHFEDGRLVVGGGGIKSETVYKVDDVVRIPDILPPVTPQASEEDIHREREQAYMLGYEDASKKFRTEPNEDCISRAEMLKYQQYLHGKMSNEENHKLWEFIKDLQSVTPQRPKGKWLHIYKSDIACECSVCHMQMPITEYYHYCPNCGAEMSGGGEDEVSD